VFVWFFASLPQWSQKIAHLVKQRWEKSLLLSFLSLNLLTGKPLNPFEPFTVALNIPPIMDVMLSHLNNNKSSSFPSLVLVFNREGLHTQPLLPGSVPLCLSFLTSSLLSLPKMYFHAHAFPSFPPSFHL
jgi:hypothetical protein